MRYTIHLQSLDIDQEEYDELKKIGFPNWIFEQAELRNIRPHQTARSIQRLENRNLVT